MHKFSGRFNRHIWPQACIERCLKVLPWGLGYGHLRLNVNGNSCRYILGECILNYEPILALFFYNCWTLLFLVILFYISLTISKFLHTHSIFIYFLKKFGAFTYNSVFYTIIKNHLSV